MTALLLLHTQTHREQQNDDRITNPRCWLGGVSCWRNKERCLNLSVCLKSTSTEHLETADIQQDKQLQILPKCSGHFLLQKHIYGKNFHEDPISSSGDKSKTEEKCRISQCWRILQKINRYRSRRGQFPKFNHFTSPEKFSRTSNQ